MVSLKHYFPTVVDELLMYKRSLYLTWKLERVHAITSDGSLQRLYVGVTMLLTTRRDFSLEINKVSKYI